MNFDDFDYEYEDDVGGSFPDEYGANESDLDLFNLRDPGMAYLFLSDDVQDELRNPLSCKLRCLLCGDEFLGQKTNQCPICYGTVFGEIL
jgi:hypothetical protein